MSINPNTPILLFLTLAMLVSSVGVSVNTTARAEQEQSESKTYYGLAMHGEPKYSPRDSHFDYANPNTPKGGILKQSATGSFDTLNPYSIKGRPAMGLNLIYDRLMARTWGEPFTMYPLIAKSVEMPDDRSWVIFNLDERARFHDGSPITADDVLFSFETLKKEGRPNQRRIYALAKKAEKLGKHRVKFTFGEGYDRETVMIFALMPVLSKKWWKGRVFDKTTLEPPLSSGPYKIADFEQGRKIVYERVPDYWAKDILARKGHNNFDKIIYDYYRDDGVALEAFKTGELNLRREWNAGLWNTAYDPALLEKANIVKEEIPHGRPDKVKGFIFNTRRPPFDDKRVRKALNLLFDADWVNKNLYHGQFKRIESYFPNTDLAYKNPFATPTSNGQKPDKRALMRIADQELKSAGWIVKNGKRVSAKTGKQMSFEIMLDNPQDEKTALALTDSLKKMGIKTNVRVLDSAAFRSRLNDYDFDMVLYFWHSTLSPGTEQYLYWSCDAASQASRWNFAGICDAEIDELVKKIAETTTRKELIEKTTKLDKKLQDNCNMISLYYNPKDYIAHDKHLHHPKTIPLYGTVLETWWWERD